MSNKVIIEKMLSGDEENPSIEISQTPNAFQKTLTPQMATWILKRHNNHNRGLSKSALEKYSSDMRNGQWGVTGEPLQFSTEGNLLNGQHRLFSLIVSKTSQSFFICTGLPPESFEKMDSGKVRSNSDVLSMKGFKEPATLSAMIRSILAYEISGCFDAKHAKNKKTGANLSFNSADVMYATKARVVEYAEKHPEIQKYMIPYKKSQVVSKGVSSFCFWLLSQVDEEKAQEYLDMIFMGLNLKPDSMETHIFSKLNRNNSAQTRMTKTAIIANVIIGWRVFMGWNKPRKQITWRQSDGLPSPFEKPKPFKQQSTSRSNVQAV